MKFKLSRASDGYGIGDTEIEANTIEDLKRIVENERCKSLVIYFKDPPYQEDKILIYDDWIE